MTITTVFDALTWQPENEREVEFLQAMFAACADKNSRVIVEHAGVRHTFIPKFDRTPKPLKIADGTAS
jgi:hypothetical protein